MTDRRETPRPARRTSKPKPQSEKPPKDWSDGERIAKWLARAGVASRRACETMIENGEIAVNGRKLTSPALRWPLFPMPLLSVAMICDQSTEAPYSNSWRI